MLRPINSVLANPDRVFQCDRLAFMAIAGLFIPVVPLAALAFQLNPIWFVILGGLLYFAAVGATFLDPFWFRRWLMLMVTFGQPIRRTYGGW